MEYVVTVVAVGFAALLCLIYCVLALGQEIACLLGEKKGSSCEPH